MFEDYKKKNSRKKTIKVKYLTKEDFYVMSKEELARSEEQTRVELAV